MNIKRNEFWHIIDGEFIHCVQEQCDNEIIYYTNGLLVGSAKFKEDGLIDEKSVKFIS